MQERMADLESLLEYNEIVRKMFANEYEGFQFYNTYALGMCYKTVIECEEKLC